MPFDVVDGEVNALAGHKASVAEQRIGDLHPRDERLVRSAWKLRRALQGQQVDEESGLHYNRHRYYDTTTGRFISHDPIRLAGGFNLYQYAPNAIQWVDPLGLTCCKCLYRGVSAKHPAIEDAKKGIVKPGNPNGDVTEDQHNAGGRSGDSPFTSWSRDPEIAK